MGWIVGILSGLWSILSKPTSLLWALLLKLWPVLLIVAVTALALWPQIKAGYQFLALNTAAIKASITNSGTTITSLTSAGWPSWMANGFSMVNQLVPCAEAMVMFLQLVGMKVSMAICRMLKSLLPVITG